MEFNAASNDHARREAANKMSRFVEQGTAVISGSRLSSLIQANLASALEAARRVVYQYAPQGGPKWVRSGQKATQ
ncbi:hypothetical protein JCM6882_008429 [Rhodosporidiobolus microsporus]